MSQEHFSYSDVFKLFLSQKAEPHTFYRKVETEEHIFMTKGGYMSNSQALGAQGTLPLCFKVLP